MRTGPACSTLPFGPPPLARLPLARHPPFGVGARLAALSLLADASGAVQGRISCSRFVPELALGSQLSLKLKELWIIVLCPLNILSILSMDPFGRFDPNFDVVEISDRHYRLSPVRRIGPIPQLSLVTEP
jgi:hypothetical protein